MRYIQSAIALSGKEIRLLYKTLEEKLADSNVSIPSKVILRKVYNKVSYWANSVLVGQRTMVYLQLTTGEQGILKQCKIEIPH